MLAKDILGIFKGLQLIANESIKLAENEIKLIYSNSNITPKLTNLFNQSSNLSNNNNNISVKNVASIIDESTSRLSNVIYGIQLYAKLQTSGPQTTSTTAIPPTPGNYSQQNLNNNSDSVSSNYQIKLSKSEKEFLRKLDMDHEEKLKKSKEELKKKDDEKQTASKQIDPLTSDSTVKAVPNPKSKQKLSSNSKQRTVPSSRIGRMVSFGSLAAGLGIGTAAEYARRTLGLGDSSNQSTLFLTQGNLDRIVDTLCKVRGAALKLGQLLSIQDDSVVNPELAKALERVRKSADFMPNWQVDKVMISEFGPNWRDKVLEFEEKPFAAASIGQVHEAKTKDGRSVAIKIQYPGVSKGIESDIDNLYGIMNLWNIFPKGMFMDNLMCVAKRELAWEVDYIREAVCTRKFKELLEPYPEYYVPYVVDELSTKQVFTTEMLYGIPVDQCFNLEEEHRQFIADKVMKLCLLEILKFRYMQTDPNWANFLYEPNKKQLLLLDFGASREYSKAFMDQYVQILKAACEADRETVLVVSKQIGFLTGYESKAMENAHVDAVMILGEVFRHPGRYDFATQDMTERIQNLAPTMITQRLCPPPEEVYSLHRKLSGLFLLCAKLKASIACRDTFLQLYNEYMSNS